MLKNKECKRFVIGEGIVLIVSILLVMMFQKILFIQYKNNLIQSNGYIIANILEKYPEFEEDIINALLNKKGDVEKGIQVLSKYGLSDIDSLDYMKDIYILKKQMMIYQISFVLFLFGLLSFIYYLFIRNQYQKINEINRYMISVLNGDYTFDIRDYEEGAISNLKNDIYRITTLLKQQIENANQGKKELETVLSDISHQLKTPLTSMYVMNDLLYDDTMDVEVRHEFLNKNKKQLERIEWLVTSLLKISRLDSGTIVLKKQKVSVYNLIQKAVEPIRIPLELKKQNIVIDCPETFLIVDENWTAEAFLNILKNAHEHSSENKDIKIIVKENNLYISIFIIDEGEGMDTKDLKNIFKRFYKGEGNKESIGIGLNMAYTIIVKQNGEIKVESKKGKGTTFCIFFYKTIV